MYFYELKANEMIDKNTNCIYSDKEHELWVNEVKEIYQKVKLHSNSYLINFLDTEITVYPNVFSPKYFNNTKWYAEKLPSIIGKGSMLEIGTGTGAIALQCCLNGAYVVATDINKDAYNCAKYNFKISKCKIKTYLGDVYEPIPINSKFDFIFWNHPYNNSVEEINDSLIIAGFDYNYNSLRKYIIGASQFLVNPNKGLLLGTGGHADLDTIFDICSENGYSLKLINSTNMPLSKGTSAPNDFRIYELIKSDIMNRDDLWKLHTIVSDGAKVSDYKAMTIFGVVGILSTLYFSLFKVDALISLKSELSLTLLLSSGFLLLIAILTAVYSVFSNLNIIYTKKSNLFFKDISDNKDLQTYLDSFSDDYDIEEDLKTQVYAISKIVTMKHLLIQRSMIFLGFAISCLTISLLSTIFL
jgi:hypothetical protein